jgi:hypothetical protein
MRDSVSAADDSRVAMGGQRLKRVIHRFHKRESCVFHSIHRFLTRFPQIRNEALTCGNGATERLFDCISSGQPTAAIPEASRRDMLIDTRGDTRIYSSGFAPKPGRI